MGIGRRKRVTLTTVLVTTDANGRNIEADGDSYRAWAEVTNPSGFRAYLNGQTQLGKTKLFKLRFRFDKYPGAEWKIGYENKEWTVSEIQRVSEKNFYWEVTAASKSHV